MSRLFLIPLAACINLPHVDPQPRTLSDQEKTVVSLEVVCGFNVAGGTGVIISERHVLTAYHVTDCPTIPSVRVKMYDGTAHNMVVSKENEKQDIARLELNHAGRFNLNIAPPQLTPYYPRENDTVCAWTRRNTVHCGPRLGPNAIAGQMKPGDSGSPVYDGGYLAGLVTRNLKEKNVTIMTIVTNDWLEGT